MKNIAIRQIFNLQGEKIDKNLEVIMDEIAKAYSIGNRNYKINEEDVIIFKIRYSKVIKTL